MPLEERTIEPEYRDLSTAIEEVLRERNTTPRHPDEPRVIWEENRFIDQVHVSVVWDKWKGVDPQARARVIIDAVEKVRGQAAASRVSLALGVTPEQAERMGIR